jgi:hypothetical protein
MEPVSIISAVIGLTKALTSVIDGISTLIDRKNYDSRIVEVYSNHIRALSKDLISKSSETFEREHNASTISKQGITEFDNF